MACEYYVLSGPSLSSCFDRRQVYERVSNDRVVWNSGRILKVFEIYALPTSGDTATRRIYSGFSAPVEFWGCLHRDAKITPSNLSTLSTCRAAFTWKYHGAGKILDELKFKENNFYIDNVFMICALILLLTTWQLSSDFCRDATHFFFLRNAIYKSSSFFHAMPLIHSHGNNWFKNRLREKKR